MGFNPLNAEINPIYLLLALLGAHHIFHVSGLRVNSAFKGVKMANSCFNVIFNIVFNTIICAFVSE